jgi:hypothetical protein
MARSEKSLEGGAMQLIQDRAPDSDEAITLANEIVKALENGTPAKRPRPTHHYPRLV